MKKNWGIYVAGPMVFWPGGEELVRCYKELCRKEGFAVPECATELEAGDAPLERARKLRRRCVERLVQSHCVIACVERFRGEEADSGTLFETGMGMALGHRIYLYGQMPPAWMGDDVYPDFPTALAACCRDEAAGVNAVAALDSGPTAHESILLAEVPDGLDFGRAVRWAWKERAGSSLEKLLPKDLRELADGCRRAIVNLEDAPGGTEPDSRMAALCGYLYGKRIPYTAYIKNPVPMVQRIPGAYTDSAGRMSDVQGNMIEPFGLPLNLMLATTMEGIISGEGEIR